MGAWWLFFFSGDGNYVELFEKKVLIYMVEMVEIARSLHVGGRVMILIFCHGQQNRCTNITSRTIAVLIVLDTKGSFTSRQLICSY